MKSEFHVKSADKDYQIQFDEIDGGTGQINDDSFSLNIIETDTGFHVLKDGKGYSVDIISVDKEKKMIELKINHKYYSYEVKDQYDDLLEKLGIDLIGDGKISEIKAPMPGLVLDVLIQVGEEVKEDQALIILEAMKMENVIKSPGDSTVKKISVSKGDSVEKNQILIEFS